MEVTHVNHLNTHAIIGGGDVQTFSTKQDAEFFEILSSTLYSNKKLAVVREVLCNSWDANIEGGKENKPVIVEITDNVMTFKDCGPGIPKEMMGDIYCTYGGSTKRHDGKKTGGFGLGSKAPFAYAKNFTVTTINGGIKSVFNISRGTSATNGVPDLRCMVSVPSKEPSGLIVSIPIQSQDREDFEKLVRDLAAMGGMLVRMNGTTLKRVIHSTEMPFTLVPARMFPSHLNAETQQRIYDGNREIKYFVKYGAVVYPIPEEFTNNRHISVETGTSLVRSQNLGVIFNAPPDSIGITPSRESLSMTDKTVETLKNLFSASNQTLKTIIPKVTQDIAPRYKAMIKDLSGAMDVTTDALFMFAKNPVKGYESLCKRIAGHVVTHQPPSVVNTLEGLQKHLVYEYLCNGWGHAEVAKVLFAEDTNGTKILKAIRDSMIKKMPLFGKQLFEFTMAGGKGNQKKEELECAAIKKVSKMLQHFESLGSTARVVVKHYSLDSYDHAAIMDMTKSSYGNQEHNAERIVTKLLYDTRITHMGQIPILLSQSAVAIERVIKDHEKKNSRDDAKYNAFISIIVRRKKEYEQVLKLLRDTYKLTNLMNIQELDALMKPDPVEHKDYLLRYIGNDAKQAVGVKRTDEEVKYYCFYPASYMIPGIEGEKLNQKKLNILPEVGRLLCYLYPNIVLVPGLAEAQKMEERGLVNVFKALAQDVEEYFLDPANNTVLLNNLQDVRGYFRSHYTGLLLRFMSPTAILEALGKNPVYEKDDREIPTVISTFFILLAMNATPKFGLQHVQRAADRTQAIFNDFIGKEINAVLEDPLMWRFLRTMPGSHEEVPTELFPIYRNAITAAMQTVIVHQHLRKKAPK